MLKWFIFWISTYDNWQAFFKIPMVLPQFTPLTLLLHKCSAIFISYSSLGFNNETFDQEMSKSGWKKQLCEVSAVHETSVKMTNSIRLDNTWRKLVNGSFPQSISLPEIYDRFTGVIFISGSIYNNEHQGCYWKVSMYDSNELFDLFLIFF